MREDYQANTVILGREEEVELKKHKDFWNNCVLAEMTGRQDDEVMGMAIVYRDRANYLKLGHMLEG